MIQCKNNKETTIFEADKGYDPDDLRMQTLKKEAIYQLFGSNSIFNSLRVEWS